MQNDNRETGIPCWVKVNKTDNSGNNSRVANGTHILNQLKTTMTGKDTGGHEMKVTVQAANQEIGVGHGDGGHGHLGYISEDVGIHTKDEARRGEKNKDHD